MDDVIKRQDAIDLVKDVCNAVMSGCESWYDPDMEDEVYKDIREVDAILKCNKEIRIALRSMPSAQSGVIRCKNCKYWKQQNNYQSFGFCENVDMWTYTDGGHYCGYAKRKNDEVN